jgi:hypothetical protein
MTIPHLSYSQFNTYSKCPRSWYLGKLRQGEEVQSWYICIGRAVHDKLEDALKGGPERPMEDYFYPLVAKQMEIEPDLTKWLAGGPEFAPITHEKALQRAVDCYEKAVQELEDIEVWEVEYDASGRLPGLSVPLKAYVDIIGEHKTKGPVIWDWKTGSTKPDNFQLETYAALLRYDDREQAGRLVNSVNYQGRYMMISPTYTSQTRYVDLSKVDPMEVGKKYEAVYRRMQAKHYETRAGFNCKFCFMQDNCLVNAGITPRSTYYDRSTDDGYPF